MTPEEKRKKLETLPWQALFDAAIQKDVEAAKLNGKDKSEIIELLIHQAMISDSEVDGLVNDYIYGNRITFTLWTFSDALGEEDYATVQALKGTTEAYLRADGFRGLRILSVKDCGDRLEVLYVYSKEYSYIDETGHSASVWEQHRGCLWIGVGTTYLACISKHDKMTLHRQPHFLKAQKDPDADQAPQGCDRTLYQLDRQKQSRPPGCRRRKNHHFKIRRSYRGAARGDQ